MAHPEFFDQPDKKECEKARKLSLRLDHVIKDVLKDAEINDFDLQSGTQFCPFCSKDISLSPNGQKNMVIMCKKCGRRFTVDTSRYRLPQEPTTTKPSSPQPPLPKKKWWEFWK